MSNVFASGAWEAMDKAKKALMRQDQQQLGEARYRDCACWFPASDDAAGMWLKPHCGGLVGDPYMVKSFVGTFREPVE
eukprot:7766841-Lingulodinium_polyedra.AAC.1